MVMQVCLLWEAHVNRWSVQINSSTSLCRYPLKVAGFMAFIMFASVWKGLVDASLSH